jgi:hypothetical protein
VYSHRRNNYHARREYVEKIPTVYVRNPDRMQDVTDEVNPEAAWVLNGEGTPTRKYDGVCVMLRKNDRDPGDKGEWFARREVKPGKEPPENYLPISTDPDTGKTVGWEPMEQSGFFACLHEALAGNPSQAGTYELCGPKVNRNPEGFRYHRLMRHIDAERPGYQFEDLAGNPKALVEALAEHGWEGVVWHAPDGRMAKLKAKDLGVKITPRVPALTDAAPEPVEVEAS